MTRSFPSAEEPSGMHRVRVGPDELLNQATVARADGFPQLAQNLERAAELALLGEGDVLAIYEALRPYRSTEKELSDLTESLRRRGASRTADLVNDARRAYVLRDILRPTEAEG